MEITLTWYTLLLVPALVTALAAVGLGIKVIEDSSSSDRAVAGVAFICLAICAVVTAALGVR